MPKLLAFRLFSGTYPEPVIHRMHVAKRANDFRMLIPKGPRTQILMGFRLRSTGAIVQTPGIPL